MTRTGPTRPDDGGGQLLALPLAHVDERWRTNLPAPFSSFVGRQQELSEVGRLLRRHRMITLTGPGGAGKTRLATEAAAELVDVFPDGVWLVELAAVNDPRRVQQSVAEVLDVREQPGRTLIEGLAGFLRFRAMLLVLDNCEHLIDASAELVQRLLRASPELHILATSREPLNLAGEVAWSVRGLAVPDRSTDQPQLRLADSESVRLFLDRVRAVKPSFVLTADTADDVVAICRLLDGMPLAIELAAARSRLLTVHEIAVGLDDCFAMLTQASRDTEARHRTLHAAISWSHDLLLPPEQAVFRRLGVFAGGFTGPAAGRVCAGPELDHADVSAVLAHLVDKSLVTARAEGDSTRYRLLEVVRQYAHQLLADAGELASVEEAHAAWCLALAAEAASRLDGAEQLPWLARLTQEHDNLRAALAWSLASPDRRETALTLTGHLIGFWFVRGHLREGLQWLEQAVAANPEDSSPGRAKALVGAAMLATFQEQYASAERLAVAGLDLFRQLGDVEGIAFALNTVGTIAYTGQSATISLPELLDEGRILRPQLRNRTLVAQMLDLEGAAALAGGELDRAVDLWQQSLAVSHEIGNAYSEAFTRSNLGMVAAARHDHQEAAEQLHKALQLALPLEYALIIQYALIGLAKVDAVAGRQLRAAVLWGAADRMSEAYDSQMTKAARGVIGYEADIATARSILGEAAWSAAWGEGRLLSYHQAAAVALADPEVEPARPTSSTGSAAGGLSAREIEVLTLVARGATNAEVAKSLFLSPRTVDWHLSSVYTKLGVRSRTEAARFAVEHDLA